MILKLKDQSRLDILDFSGETPRKEHSRYYGIEVGKTRSKEKHIVTMSIDGADEDYKEFTEKLDAFLKSYTIN